MDRRQKKTREAVFSAFTVLLSRKSYSKITIQEIIDEANVGRTTFYAHFETKDDLLKALCASLFGHIVVSAVDASHTHGVYSDGTAPQSIFCHLLQHLQENDRNILTLLSCESSELFLRYFKDSLNEVLRQQFLQNLPEQGDLPEDFLLNHISGSFVDMVLWWIRGRMQYSPEQLDRWFRQVIEPCISAE